MFFVKILVSARLPGASVLQGGGVPDAPRRGQDPSLQSRSKEGCNPLGNTAQFPPDGLSTAPAAAARHLRCQNAR